MNAMALRDRSRNLLRRIVRWLAHLFQGQAARPLSERIARWFADLAALPDKDMLNALELREKQRHEALLGMLNRIEQRMINEHVGQPREFTPPVLAWETVEAMALHNLQNTPPPKEYQDGAV
jgi:plasmid stabilization system protein ParE